MSDRDNREAGDAQSVSTPNGGALGHTDGIRNLLNGGHRSEAVRLHSDRVDAELERAALGQPINLTDLLAATEELRIQAWRTMQ